jgi:hypothetical protein
MLPLLALAADDPAGWSKARWGMTDQQIIDGFAGQAVRLDPPDKVNGARVWIESLDLAGTNFQVYMVPDKDGRLSSVLLSPRDLADGTDSLFQTLGELLVQKYGRPWKTGEEDGITEEQWTFSTTVVTLTRGKLPMTKTRIVNIQYRKKSPDLDKL